jgi:hypothetical protein
MLPKLLECDQVLLLTLHQINTHASKSKSQRVGYGTYPLNGIYHVKDILMLVSSQCIKQRNLYSKKLMSKCTEKHAGTLHKFLECNQVLLLTIHQVNTHASQIKSKRVTYSTYSLIGIDPFVQYITLVTTPQKT